MPDIGLGVKRALDKILVPPSNSDVVTANRPNTFNPPPRPLRLIKIPRQPHPTGTVNIAPAVHQPVPVIKIPAPNYGRGGTQGGQQGGLTAVQEQARKEGRLAAPESIGQAVIGAVRPDMVNIEGGKQGWTEAKPVVSIPLGLTGDTYDINLQDVGVTIPNEVKLVGGRRIDLKGLLDLAVSVGADPMTYVGLPPLAKAGAKDVGKVAEAVSPALKQIKSSETAAMEELLAETAAKAPRGKKVPEGQIPKGKLQPVVSPKGAPVVKAAGEAQEAPIPVETGVATEAGKVPPVKPPEVPKTGTTPPLDVNAFLKTFKEAVTNPNLAQKSRAIDDIVKQEKGKRIGAFADELASGKSFDEALKSLEGKYAKGGTTLGDLIPEEVRPLLEKNIAEKFADDPWKVVSTTEAFRKALVNDKIAREVGVKGGSQYSRLVDWLGEDVVKGWDDAIKGRTRMTLDQATLDAIRKFPLGGKQLTMLEPSQRVKLAATLHKIGVNALDVLGIPKSLKFSLDLSMMSRQLGIAGARHPVRWLKTWKPYAQAMRSESLTMKLNSEIVSDPEVIEGIQRMGADMMDVSKGAVWTKRPEGLASAWAEKYIPGIRMSNRGAAVAINYFMADAIKQGMRTLKKMNAVDADYKSMGQLINWEVGRGTLPKQLRGTAGDIVNKVFTSPRFFFARTELPTKLFAASKPVRQEAWSTLAAWAGLNASLMGLAVFAGAKSLEGDPRSSENLKIRIGNKRIDVWNGYAQLIRFTAQMMPYADGEGHLDLTKGSRKNAAGQIIPVDRTELMKRFLQSKESPGIGALVTLFDQMYYTGEKVRGGWKGVGEFMVNALVPAGLEEMVNAFILEGWGSAALSFTGFAGVGVNTYKEDKVQTYRLLSQAYHAGENYAQELLKVGEVDKLQQFIQDHPELMLQYDGKNVKSDMTKSLGNVTRQINALDKKREAIILSKDFTDNEKKQLLEYIKEEQERMAVETLQLFEGVNRQFPVTKLVPEELP